MTTLVVGATGTIGLKTIEALRAKGKPVRGLVRPDSNAAPVEALGATVVRGDMMKPETLTAAFGAAAPLLVHGCTRRAETRRTRRQRRTRLTRPRPAPQTAWTQSLCVRPAAAAASRVTIMRQTAR
jgi:uncharacterized protein YbjT (DUF2867 family)